MSPRRILRSLWSAAREGVDPETLVRRRIDSNFPNASRGRRGLFAAGKAASAMARGARGLPFDDALLVVCRGTEVSPELRRFTIEASHPEPDRMSVVAARRAIEFFGSFGSGDQILALISGGASSLLCLPRAGATLDAKRQAIRSAMRAGMSIEELNAMRIRLSGVKGGRLAEATRARVETFVLADVPRRSWRLTGSAPTISRRKPGDRSFLVGWNGTGISGAADRARNLGFDVAVEHAPLAGEARDAGARFARRLLHLSSRSAEPVALLGGGETTVTIRGRAGRGGRNQEFALGAALALAGRDGAAILAAGSDGIDGNSANAGAFVDGSTLARSIRAGENIREVLERHDSARLFERLGDAFVTGATGTNVADWAFGIASPALHA